jgi:hypothetical protein
VSREGGEVRGIEGDTRRVRGESIPYWEMGKTLTVHLEVRYGIPMYSGGSENHSQCIRRE